MENSSPLPRPTSFSKVREIINALNRADYTHADYSYLTEQISTLLTGSEVMGAVLPKSTVLYRGVCHRDKPDRVSLLGSPPPEKVLGFQRCNAPNKPMFYASVNDSTVLAEINAQENDRVYISKWMVEKEFIYFRNF